MEKRSCCKNKLSRKGRFTFGELCYWLIMMYIAVIMWYSHYDPSPTKKHTKPNLEKNSKNVREYLKRINNPTIIYWTSFTEKSEFRTLKCGELLCDFHSTTSKLMLPPNSEGAYLFYASITNFSNMPLPRNPQKVIWAVQHEESPKNILFFMHEKCLKLFNFSSTFSRHSDIPYPLHYMESLGQITTTKYFVKTELKNRAMKQISPILYMQSSCVTQTGRDEYVRELMKYQRIDSYGLCLNNKPLPNHLKETNKNYLNNLNHDQLHSFMARYKFVLAIENGVCDDYVTEKFWRAIHLGIVPIYYGAPTIRDWLPNKKSALLVDEFSSPKVLSDRIDELLQNDDLYEEYLQHKTKGLISNHRIIKEIKARPYQTDDQLKDSKFNCFICEKLHQREKSLRVVSKSHYNCSKAKPIWGQSKELYFNMWSQKWIQYKTLAENLYNDWMNVY